MAAPTVLTAVGLVFAALAALTHVWFWVLESLTWRRESTWRLFGVRSAADAETMRPMALNQGYYNLFLAAGTAAGIALSLTAALGSIGFALTLFCCLFMVGAALVLLASNRRLARAAAAQGAFPLVATVLLVLSAVTG